MGKAKRGKVPAQLAPFLFVARKRGSKKRRSARGVVAKISRGFTMAKRKKRMGGGGGGGGGGLGSFFGKPVAMTVVGAAAASAFGPRLRAMLPASLQTGGGLAAAAVVGLGGGYLISRFAGKEAGAGFAAGFLAPEIGGMFGGAPAAAGARPGALRGLPGESTGVDYLPLDGIDEDEMAGIDDDELSGYETDALET